MTPLAILQDIITIARAIHAQVSLMKRNQDDLHDLATIMQQIVTSLQGLATLPDNQQFIESLTAFQQCLTETQQFIQTLSKMGLPMRIVYAQTNESKIAAAKQRMIEFIPLMSLGLNAQLLIDREKDRRNALADRQALMDEKAQNLRDIQAAARIDPRELEEIIRKQMHSVQHRLAKQFAPAASPLSPSLPEELMVHLDDIIFERKMGEGDLGAIYQGTWREQPVTIKCFDHTATDAERHQLAREAQVMSRLHHEAIAQFYGACLDSERMCLLMSIMEKGDLFSTLSLFSITDRLQMAKDLARGLAYLHAHDMVHGDIQPKHIGVNRYNQAKWTDFGLVKVRSMNIATLAKMSQEAAWQAPESWQNRAALSPASDIYSFGMLLWTLMTGQLPYANSSPSSIMRLVQRGEREAIPGHWPRALITLIEACWNADASQRPEAKQVANALQTMQVPEDILPRSSSPTGEEYYERGVMSERAGNLEEAYQDYHRSSQKGFFKAYTSVGLFALQGLGGQTVDKPKAQAYIERGAASGHPRAMFNLARIHEKGYTKSGIPDVATALFWYEKAHKADPEDPRAAEKVRTLRTPLR